MSPIRDHIVEDLNYSDIPELGGGRKPSVFSAQKIPHGSSEHVGRMQAVYIFSAASDTKSLRLAPPAP